MKNKRNDKNIPPRVNEAINAYKSVADPLGSYTGITEDMVCMPRKTVDGKIYMKVENPPKQDEDDL